MSLLQLESWDGTLPSCILRATSSTTAVLPTPGWPSKQTLGLLRRDSTRNMRSTSFSRPCTVSSMPCAAMATRSVPKRANADCSSEEPSPSWLPVPVVKEPKGSALSLKASACDFAPPAFCWPFDAWLDEPALVLPSSERTRSELLMPTAVKPPELKVEATPLAGSKRAAQRSSRVTGPGGPRGLCALAACSNRGTLPSWLSATGCFICLRSSMAMP
mmetsp:Transcript_43147/g.101372  ORF Transcript_43147/g.101372 Transcript_43147/m.101372 type:complete len:217 (+) Transcript_43147:706-1356(+)